MLHLNLDYNKIKEHENDLINYNGYIPIVLLKYIDKTAYFNNINQKVRHETYEMIRSLPYVEDINEFLLNDLKDWIKENPKFNGIYIKQND